MTEKNKTPKPPDRPKPRGDLTHIGEIIPAEITIFSDGSFRFELKSPPSTFLIKRAAGIDKGSAVPQTTKVGKVTRKQLAEIAEQKLKDMNTQDIAKIVLQLEGTARQMGVEVVD